MESAVNWCEKVANLFLNKEREIIITRPWKRLRPTCWVKYDRLPGNESPTDGAGKKTNRVLAQCQVMLSSRMSDKGIIVDRKFHKRRGGKLTKNDRNCSRNWDGAPVNGAAGRSEVAVGEISHELSIRKGEKMKERWLHAFAILTWDYSGMNHREHYGQTHLLVHLFF